MRALLPDFLFSGGRVHAGAALIIRDGIVLGIGEPPEEAEVIPMRGRALLPGLVAAHSHAFQRAIRGRTEHRSHARDDFWSWREAMYAAAERLTPDDLHSISKFCFLEMARVGITAVGEFHYLHRDASGKPYVNPNELDLAVARAAQDAGLRVVLLRVAYARSGFRLPENPRQKRFIEGSVDEYLQNLDALSRQVPVGAAPHSVRACPLEWIRDIAAEAVRRGWPLHLHVSEQRAEVEQSQAEHGTTPALVLERLGALRESTTAVHGVHLTAQDIAALGRARATVCACPTTERNLGDGVVRADLLLAAGARLCVGSDSEVQISPLEDARQLEYHLRLLQEQRAVLDAEQGGVGGLEPGGMIGPGALLRELSAVDSTSARSNLPLLDVLERQVRALGLATRRQIWTDASGVQKANLIAQRGGEKGGLALVGHTDCVPFDVAWAGALEAAVEDGKVSGRGAADTKAFLAAAITAASRTQGTPLQLVFTADEEVGCLGARRLVDEGALRPRHAVVGEPTRMTPILGHKGYCLAEVTVHGAEGHSAYPETGASAILAAGRVLREVERIGEELRADADPLFAPPHATLNVGLIAGGKAKNVIPGLCTLTVEWRPLPSQDARKVLRLLEDACARVQTDRIRIEVAVQRLDGGIVVARDAEIV